MPIEPQSPAHHLSADLLFRFLPAVHHRAKAQENGEPLVKILADIFCHWPLSGVLSEVTEKPTGDLSFNNHSGLLFLYAERWCRKEKRAWFPDGPAKQYIELVWYDLGKDPKLLPTDASETPTDEEDQE